MSDFPTWPHLENLDRVLAEYDPSFLTLTSEDDCWVVTEKVHGFNARFGKTLDGTPWVGSRNQVPCTGYPALWPAAGLQGFIGYAAGKVELLNPGETLFGEWAGNGIQKGIDYGERDFYLFGACYEKRWRSDGEARLWSAPEDLFSFVAEGIECKTAPRLGLFFEPPTLEWLTAQRDAKSLLAEQAREGVVIVKWPIPTDTYGHPVIAKFKSAAFSEVSRAPKAPKELPDMEQVMSLVDRYATPKRMDHVLAQVQEYLFYNVGSVQTALAPGSTGYVLRAMHDDIIREAGTEFTDLSEDAQKAFGKALNPTAKRLLDDARLAAAVAAA